MQRKFSLLLFLVIQLSFVIKLVSSYQPYNDTSPDYGASVHHLRHLCHIELHLFPTVFTAYEKELEGGAHASMGSYIKDFESSYVGSAKDNVSLKQLVFLLRRGNVNVGSMASETIKHPLKSYRVIRRFVRFIGGFDDPEITKSKNLVRAITEVRQQIKLPKESDLQVAMENILRLRKIFKLTVNDLLEGQLGDLNTGSGLSVSQLVEIAEHATSLKMFSHAVDLYQGAIERCGENLQKDFMDCSMLNVGEINGKLDTIIKEHDSFFIGSGFDPNDLDVLPPDSSPFVFDHPLKNRSSEEFLKRRSLQVDEELELYANRENATQFETNMAMSPFLFEKLCRGESLHVDSNTKRIRCFYLSSPHPAFAIAPLKVEVHSEDPYILQIYDILSEEEIRNLQDEVKIEMRLSRTTATEGDDDGQTSRFRTSANAWIEDNVDARFGFLNEKIAQTTGLNTTGYYSSEIVQVAAYNPGGHYTPHSDAMFEDVLMSRLPPSEFERGDRIMTFMIYLSEVERGGGTAFPTLRRLIKPVKGSAVLWYNLHSNGTINYNTLHGGCPVLYGTKWIANKWIRSNDQMFARKCPKSKEPWRI